MILKDKTFAAKLSASAQKLLLSTALFLPIAASDLLASQNQNQNSPDEKLSVTSEHKPNAHTLKCLEALSRDCTINAALQTVIAEDFGLERAKVLTGVARALAAVGDSERAQRTLALALDEARSVRINIAFQEKIKEIAPVMVQAGDMAGALAISEEVDIPKLRDQVLMRLSREATKIGSLPDARTALNQMENKRRSFWLGLVALSQASAEEITEADIKRFEMLVRALDRPDQQYRGFVLLGIAEAMRGSAGSASRLMQEADALFQSVLGFNLRADVTVNRLVDLYQAKVRGEVLADSYNLAILHGDRLRSQSAQEAFAMKIGAVEVELYQVDKALSRVAHFEDQFNRILYITSLVPSIKGKGANISGPVLAAVRQELSALSEIESAYDRDSQRLILLNAAYKAGNLDLMIEIIKQIEDDDNQAYGLALTTPLIPE